jgi:tetratricopeptide (TPR) repeat protein
MAVDSVAIKQQAEELRKAKEYAEALPLYEQLWNEQADEVDEWVGWGYATCLSKLNRHNEALEVCRKVYRQKPDFSYNNNLYGWIIYELGIRQPPDAFDEVQFLKAANAITQLTKHETYSPYERTVFEVIRYYKRFEDQEKPVPYTTILSWLDKLEPSELSPHPQVSKDGKSFPSSLENWLTNRAKALFELEQHEECIEACTEALNRIKSFHFDYDVWLRHYRGLCFLALDRPDEALNDLTFIADRRTDAWAQRNLATAHFKLGNFEQSLILLAQCALPPKGLLFRWEVFLDLGETLEKIGDLERAAQHVLLAWKIRNENDAMKVPLRLNNAIQRLNVPNNDPSTSAELHKQLRPFWKSLKPLPQHKGKIHILHANGKSGMILAESGQMHFFSMKSISMKPDDVYIGMPVAFNMKDVINNKTGLPEQHAVDVGKAD